MTEPEDLLTAAEELEVEYAAHGLVALFMRTCPECGALVGCLATSTLTNCTQHN